MTPSRLGKRISPVLIWQKLSRIHLATLVMVGTVMLSGLVVTAWFSGEGTISRIFQHLNQWEEHPPMWVVAPMMVGNYLMYWTVALLLAVLMILRVSPRPRPWSRRLVVGVLAVLTVRYLLWRSLSTLNLSTPLNGVFSLGLFFLELLLLIGGMIQLVLLLQVRDRRPEADLVSLDIASGILRQQ
jgi:cellulose synthase (UDP-forming)